MSGARVERRLTAILAADIAGYSRLMGRDEEETLAQLKAHRRELFDPKIAEPDLAEQAERYGATLTVIAWASRLRCSACNGHEIGFVVSDARR